MKILLTTLHAKYSHASLALPCLASCCAGIGGLEIEIREFTVNEPREQLLRLIMAGQAGMVAFSCYIWNIEKTLRIAADIKGIAPETLILLGGPEASFGVFELMHGNPAVDFVIKGEGEAIFARLAALMADSGGAVPDGALLQDIPNLFFRDGDDIASGPLDRGHIELDSIPSPFEAGLVDLSRPLTYCETSRGCPFTCAFCLSSVEGRVRSFSMGRIQSDLLYLMGREVPKIKLVDRTFNYDDSRAREIWGFILAHSRGSHYHFEIAADLLTDQAIELLRQVPEGTFRFEIGIQSASHRTLELAGRKSDLGRVFYVIRRLLAETKVELHLDLVAGLPEEGYAGFLSSLKAVCDLQPHEIQVEPLKVLKGSPMREIAARGDYRFSSFPPYTVLRTPWLSYGEICRIETIGRLLDLFHNQGGFATAFGYLALREGAAELYDRMAVTAGDRQLAGCATLRRYELFFELACSGRPADDDRLADALFFDFCTAELPRRGKLPGFIARREGECSWPGGRDESGGRSRQFRFTFRRDYRKQPWNDSPAEITFSYPRISDRADTARAPF